MTPNEFIAKMDADIAEGKEMIDADENLVKAIERFEKAYNTKLKVTMHEPETIGKPNTP